MSEDDAKDTIDYLRACALANISRGSMWDVEMCTKAIALIERLAADIARLTADVERLKAELADAKSDGKCYRSGCKVQSALKEFLGDESY